MGEAQRPQVGIGVYVFNEKGQLLLGKRRGSHGAGEYATPGGALELLESWRECAIREVLEETGLHIGNLRVFRVENILAYAPKHYVDIAIRAVVVGGALEVREPDKVESWGWHDPGNLPRPLFDSVPSALRSLRYGGGPFVDRSGDLTVPSNALVKPPLKIYFGTSISGGMDYDRISSRIAELERYGEVLTKHMASPRTVDKTDGPLATFVHDQELLAQADLFVADRDATPSEGTAFMMARAVQLGIPCLYLYRERTNGEATRVSAMIAGCLYVERIPYADDKDFSAALRNGLMLWAEKLEHVAFAAPKVFLAGPPGSGKGTLGTALAEATGMIHVSTGDLLRDIVDDSVVHPHKESIQACMREGRLVPAAVMRDIVLERLACHDCRMFGFILDGYPPSKDDLQNLREAGVLPDVVFYLDCSADTAAGRIVKRAARPSDTPETARRRQEVFSAAEMDCKTLGEEWFPESVVLPLDAEMLTPKQVLDDAIEALDVLYGSAERGSAVRLGRPLSAQASHSTRFHFHVDAKDARTVRDIGRAVLAAHKPALGRMKLYPIEHLRLGPQACELAVYRQMPNFHGIDGATDEAFITGRLGDMDTDLMLVVLAETMRRGGMAELEQYLGEWTLTADGRITEDARYPRLDFDHRVFADFVPNLCNSIPPVELHLGFNLAKRRAHPIESAPPIELGQLVDECKARGIVNGGWFIFKDADVWKYRSNEFTFDEPNCATTRLFAQAKALRDIVRGHTGIDTDISFSIELVHGIWTAR